jgi:hypothetical protein
MATLKFKIGDLVRLYDPFDEDRQIGIIVDVNPHPVHVVSHGKSNVVSVYWPNIPDTDWEYDFFLTKLTKEDLTKDKK